MTTGADAWGWRVASDEDSCSDDQARATSPAQDCDPASETEPLLGAQQNTQDFVNMVDDGVDLISNRPAHLTQYVTAACATLGSLAMGGILGYSSPAGPQLQEADNTTGLVDCGGELSLSLTSSQISLFSSSVNIGALIGAPLGGVLIKVIGRRTTMVSTIVPFTLGWLLIGLASNFGMLIAGRIFCGICAGLVSLSVPTYVGEIASSDIRGMLGSGFQLMVVIGIMYSYSIGAATCWQWLALACFVPAALFCVSMFFNKESPSYLVTKGQEDAARASLTYLRGREYNIEPELQRLKTAAEEERSNKVSFRDLFKPYIMKPLSIALALMFFQQTSGVNAILFNLTTIFESANTSMSPEGSSILISGVQVVMTAVAAGFIDRAGRKLLLIISSAAMALSLVAMGVYFYLAEQENEAVDSLGWLPLASLIIFISFFSIGYGPIPWVMMGELFTADIREVAGTLCTLTNWGMSFIITLIFQPLRNAIGDSGVYWLFAGFCVINFFYCLLVVKETKGKTIEEINAMFGGPTSSPRTNDTNAQTDNI